ncbi:hypothetical protein FACS18949_04190 [Clostridia bacterium]|nr:hypothetical protein FACS18949_04190 [Clostridia bacterium]
MLNVVYAENFAPLVRSLTAYSRDEQAAEDAVQQAFVQALGHQELLDGMSEKSLRSWLYATAKNALIDAKRRQSRVLALDPDYDAPSDDPDPTDRVIVAQLLEQLPEDLRQIVELRYFAGMNATLIGQTLDMNPATVRTKLRAAINKMRRDLQ